MNNLKKEKKLQKNVVIVKKKKKKEKKWGGEERRKNLILLHDTFQEQYLFLGPSLSHLTPKSDQHLIFHSISPQNQTLRSAE